MILILFLILILFNNFQFSICKIIVHRHDENSMDDVAVQTEKVVQLKQIENQIRERQSKIKERILENDNKRQQEQQKGLPPISKNKIRKPTLDALIHDPNEIKPRKKTIQHHVDEGKQKIIYNNKFFFVSQYFLFFKK